MVICMIMAWRYFSKNFEPTNDKPYTMTEVMNNAAEQGKVSARSRSTGPTLRVSPKTAKRSSIPRFRRIIPTFYNVMNVSTA